MNDELDEQQSKTVLIPTPPPTLRERQEDVEVLRAAGSYSHLTVIHEGEHKVGTVVMMRSRHRLFALTADHCVHNQMAIHFRLKDDSEQTAFKILRVIRGTPLDVAILELEENPNITACDIRQLSVEPLVPFDPNDDPSKAKMVWIVGYLRALGTVDLKKMQYRAQQCAVGTNVLFAEDEKLTLYYHEDAYLMAPNEVLYAYGRTPETPKGFSGGGVWGRVQDAPGELYNPARHLQLHAIEYAWDDTSRWVFCVPSRVVKKMLLDNYPELENEFHEIA